MASTAAPRRDRYRHLQVSDHLGLLDDELDEAQRRDQSLEAMLDRINARLNAVLATLATTAVLFAANLLVQMTVKR